MQVLTEVVLRLSQLVTDFNEINEFDVNPFIASSKPEASMAVDARFILK